MIRPVGRRLILAARGVLSRHRLFVTALAAATLLRVATELGYRWALWFNDSFDYVAIAQRMHPDPIRPIGYPLLLRLVGPLHSLALVTALQHLLGLAIGVLGYLLLRRRFGLPGRAATLAMVPVLFDAYQIQLEQLLLADTLFTFLAVAAVTLLCLLPAARGGPMSGWQAALAGALLALAALTRPVGIPLIVIAIAYLIICRVGWHAITAACVAACAPLTGYVLWYHASHGKFALDATDGIYLWGRTAAFADCSVIRPPPGEAWLCPRLPAARRSASAAQVWQPTSPFHWQHGQVFGAKENDLAMRFALRAIARQPGAYARTVLVSTGRAFTWDRTAYPTSYTASLYTFAGAKTWLPAWPEPGGQAAAEVARSYADGPAATVVAAPYAALMRWYQRYIYLRGTLVGIILIIPSAAAFATVLLRRRAEWLAGGDPATRLGPGGGSEAPGQGNSSGEGPQQNLSQIAGISPGQTRRQSPGGAVPENPEEVRRDLGDQTRRARPATWLCWSAAVALLVVPPLTVDFDYRYVLPLVPFGCLAVALAARRFVLAVGNSAAGQTPGHCRNTAAVSICTDRDLTAKQTGTAQGRAQA